MTLLDVITGDGPATDSELNHESLTSDIERAALGLKAIKGALAIFRRRGGR